MSSHSDTSQPRAPRMVNGALVHQAEAEQAPTYVVFQYNPATLRRSIPPQMVGGEPGDRSETVRFTGAPVETITLDVEFDATEPLPDGPPRAVSTGVAPQLAALELMAYPKSTDVVRRQQMLADGTMEGAPAAAPALHLVWGPKRVLPVRIDSFHITEEDFDQDLNPVRATVGITMRVLTPAEVASDDAAYNDFVTYQRSLEAIAERLTGHAARLGDDPSTI